MGFEGPSKVYSFINAVGLWAKVGTLDQMTKALYPPHCDILSTEFTVNFFSKSTMEIFSITAIMNPWVVIMA